MSSVDDLCVHGRPVDEPCDGVCEHGVRCGLLCPACDREYRAALRDFCASLGDGDVERGRRTAIAILAGAPAASRGAR